MQGSGFRVVGFRIMQQIMHSGFARCCSETCFPLLEGLALLGTLKPSYSRQRVRVEIVAMGRIEVADAPEKQTAMLGQLDLIGLLRQSLVDEQSWMLLAESPQASTFNDSSQSGVLPAEAFELIRCHGPATIFLKMWVLSKAGLAEAAMSCADQA